MGEATGMTLLRGARDAHRQGWLGADTHDGSVASVASISAGPIRRAEDGRTQPRFLFRDLVDFGHSPVDQGSISW